MRLKVSFSPPYPSNAVPSLICHLSPDVYTLLFSSLDSPCFLWISCSCASQGRCVAGVSPKRGVTGIEIPREFFLCSVLGTDPGKYSAETVDVLKLVEAGEFFCDVEVCELCNVKRMTVVPVLKEDFDLLDIYSEELSLVLLEQIHAVSVGQMFPVALGMGGARVSVSVKVVDVETDNKTSRFGRLSTLTELVVVPSIEQESLNIFEDEQDVKGIIPNTLFMPVDIVQNEEETFPPPIIVISDLL